MCDIFRKCDARSALRGRNILMLGDSIMRNLYKDLIHLLSDHTRQEFISQFDLKTKGEESFLGDRLVDFDTMSRSRTYIEVREWTSNRHYVRITYAFLTRCYSSYVERFLENFMINFHHYPDIIIMNSAIWDINRWGPDGISNYKINLKNLVLKIATTFPLETQFVWVTTPPISVEVRGAVLVRELAFQKLSIRFNILEANHFAATIAAASGYDVIDLHYYLSLHIHRRASDGIHWNPDAVRLSTNVILTHFCLSRDMRLPGIMRSYGRDPEEDALADAERIAFQAVEDIRNISDQGLRDISIDMVQVESGQREEQGYNANSNRHFATARRRKFR